MDDLRRLIRLAARHLGYARAVSSGMLTALVSSGVVLVWLALSKGFPALKVEWWVGAIAVAIVLVASIIAALMRRGRDDVSIAVAIDQRLGLKERFATAIEVAHRGDPFAVAAVADAAKEATAKGMPSRVKRAFRPTPPSGWWMTPIVLVVLVFTWMFVPQGDLLAETASDTQSVRNAVASSNDELQAIIEAVEENPLLAEAMADVLAEMRADADGLGADMEPRAPEDIRREAIRKASEMQERLEEMLSGDAAAMEQSLRKNLEGLKSTEGGDPDAESLAKALKKGDFSAAKDALEKLASKVQEGDLSPEEQAKLKEQLEALAKELGELAKKKDALKKALEEAGMDPDLADNPEALKQAIENSSSLNEQQKKQLKKDAESQQAASKSCQGLGQACKNMAESMSQPGQSGQQGQLAGQQMGDMLSDLESMQQMLQQAQSAAGQCQGACEGLGEGLGQWAAALQNQQKPSGGGGMGKWGSGQGGNAPIAPTPSGTKIQREKVAVRDGDIIARQLIEGEQVVGEAKARLKQLSNTIARGHEESVRDDPIPPHLRDVHKRYFGEVQKRIEARVGSETKAAPEAAAPNKD